MLKHLHKRGFTGKPLTALLFPVVVEAFLNRLHGLNAFSESRPGRTTELVEATQN